MDAKLPVAPPSAALSIFAPSPAAFAPDHATSVFVPQHCSPRAVAVAPAVSVFFPPADVAPAARANLEVAAVAETSVGSGAPENFTGSLLSADPVLVAAASASPASVREELDIAAVAETNLGGGASENCNGSLLSADPVVGAVSGKLTASGSSANSIGPGAPVADAAKSSPPLGSACALLQTPAAPANLVPVREKLDVAAVAETSLGVGASKNCTGSLVSADPVVGAVSGKLIASGSSANSPAPGPPVADVAKSSLPLGADRVLLPTPAAASLVAATPEDGFPVAPPVQKCVSSGEPAGAPVAPSCEPSRLRHATRTTETLRQTNRHPVTFVISACKTEAAGVFPNEIATKTAGPKNSKNKGLKKKGAFFQAQLFGVPGQRGAEKEANRKHIAAIHAQRGCSVGCMVGQGSETWVATKNGRAYIPHEARAIAVCALDGKALTPQRITTEIAEALVRVRGRKNVQVKGQVIKTVSKTEANIFEDHYLLEFAEDFAASETVEPKPDSEEEIGFASD